MPADTIVALSSGSTPSGVAVVRLSGPGCRGLAVELCGRLPPARTLTLRTFVLGGQAVDRGLVVYMPGPGSFTGEDCLELHLHGSAAVVRAVLRHLGQRPGFKLAVAGEFTRRAFENGKLDLPEVQGLGDLLAAETENQRRIALWRAAGGLSAGIAGWRERLLDLRALIEAQLDFSDEDDVGELPESFGEECLRLETEIAALIATFHRGRIMRDGYRVLLAGPPNAGKSSLLNALARSDVAIVSDEPGTTRDLKEVPLDVDGQLIILIDSAGLRDTESRAEALGVERARLAMKQVDLVIWLLAPDIPAEPPPVSDTPVFMVATKSDMGGRSQGQQAVSAYTGAGLSELLAEIAERAGSKEQGTAMVVSHEIDRISLQRAQQAIAEARYLLAQPELAAEALRSASDALARMLGTLDAEAMLDRLFAGFCIGK